MSKETNSSGIGFLGLLTIAFIVLKLCNVVDWSWWWVLMPTYGPVAVLVITLPIIYYFDKKIEKANEKIEAEKRRASPSKFMRRLQEVIDEQEKNKKQN